MEAIRDVAVTGQLLWGRSAGRQVDADARHPEKACLRNDAYQC